MVRYWSWSVMWPGELKRNKLSLQFSTLCPLSSCSHEHTWFWLSDDLLRWTRTAGVVVPLGRSTVCHGLHKIPLHNGVQVSKAWIFKHRIQIVNKKQSSGAWPPWSSVSLSPLYKEGHKTWKPWLARSSHRTHTMVKFSRKRWRLGLGLEVIQCFMISIFCSDKIFVR